MDGKFAIDGNEIKNPSKFKIERYNLTQSSRVASGQMMMELIAKKRKFYFTYEAISATELNVILDAIWETDEVFFELTYTENNQRKTATVYTGSIPTELHRGDDDEWIWKDVSINFIEQ